jgi:DNA-binding transcriptional ArsR family regulator
MSEDAGALARPADAAIADARRLLALVNGGWATQAIGVAARLGLADRLAAGPCSADALADALGLHAPSLTRLLRALVTLEVCEARDDGRYALGALGAPLCRDAVPSLAAWATYASEDSWALWGRLADSVRSGVSARQASRVDDGGAPSADAYAGAGPTFDRAMAELLRLDVDAIVAAIDLAGCRTLVDVGGGAGDLLVAMLAANPDVAGVLVERPALAEAARVAIAASAVAARARVVAGDFFDALPAHADAYVLKSVLHNWRDGDARRILARCAAALRPRASRLFVVERLLPARLDASPRHQAMARADLNMLVSRGGQERGEAGYRALLASAGLEVASMRAAGPTFTVLEAVTA